MVTLFKLLYSVNSVKKEINKVLALVKSHHARLETIEKKIEKLAEKSHPPIFTQSQYESIDCRISYVEAFVNNLVEVADDKKNVAN